MNINYVAEIQSTSIPDEQRVSVDILYWIRIQVARPGYMYPGDMRPAVNAALIISVFSAFNDLSYFFTPVN